MAWHKKLLRFLRTPKGLLLLLLLALLVPALASAGWRLALPGVAGAVGAAAIGDLTLLRWRHGRWEFPSGALLTGLIVAMVLSPQLPAYVAAVTAALGIGSKYVFRSRHANVFNPAALGLVATFYLFHTGQSWWGALPEVSDRALPYALVALAAAGIYIAARVNKLALVVAFFGAYYVLITLTAFSGSGHGVAELYRTPDLQAALYFAFFILTDPPTSPPKQRQQVTFGILVGAVSFGFFLFVGAAYYLLAGVLAGNVWEARRRGWGY